MGFVDKDTMFLSQLASENFAKPGTYDEHVVSHRIQEYKDNKKKKGKAVFDLSNIHLQTLPQEVAGVWIEDAAELERVDLSQNALEELPTTVAAINKIKQFKLDNNNLTKLPQSFAALTLLEELYLGWNNFSEFPIAVTKLPKLRILVLTWNVIESLPDDIEKLTALEKLDLSSNKLETVPVSLTRVSTLTSLLLNNNKLHDLPAEFATSFPTLRLLDLTGNKLSKRVMTVAEGPDSVQALQSKLNKVLKASKSEQDVSEIAKDLLKK